MRCPAHGGTPQRDCPACEQVRRWHATAHWIAGPGPWDVFTGCTFDPKGKPARGMQAARTADGVRQRVFNFIKRGEQQLGRPLILIGGVDHHLLGDPHAHLLIKAEGGITERERGTLTASWYRTNGACKLEVPQRQSRVAGYVARVIVTNDDPAGLIIWPEGGRIK